MTKSSFHKLLLGSVLMLLPFTVQAQVVLKNWTIEDHSGKVKNPCIKRYAGNYRTRRSYTLVQPTPYR